MGEDASKRLGIHVGYRFFFLFRKTFSYLQGNPVSIFVDLLPAGAVFRRTAFSPAFQDHGAPLASYSFYLVYWFYFSVVEMSLSILKIFLKSMECMIKVRNALDYFRCYCFFVSHHHEAIISTFWSLPCFLPPTHIVKNTWVTSYKRKVIHKIP